MHMTTTDDSAGPTGEGQLPISDHAKIAIVGASRVIDEENQQ